MWAPGRLAGATLAGALAVTLGSVGVPAADAGYVWTTRTTNEDIRSADAESPPGPGGWYHVLWEQEGPSGSSWVVSDGSAAAHRDGSFRMVTPSEEDVVHLQRMLAQNDEPFPRFADFTGRYAVTAASGPAAAYTIEVGCPAPDVQGRNSNGGTLHFAGPYPEAPGWHTIDVVQDRQTLWWADRTWGNPELNNEGMTVGLEGGRENPHTLQDYIDLCPEGTIGWYGIKLDTAGADSRVDEVRFNDRRTNFWTPRLRRLAGEDRRMTSCMTAGQRWSSWAVDDVATSQEVPRAVVVVNQNRYRDALVAGPLANAAGGPLIVHPRHRTDPRRPSCLGVAPDGTTAYLIGGRDALNGKVASYLQNRGNKVVRIVGRTPYATAVKVANMINRLRPPGQRRRLFLANGEGYPDALTASAAAGASHGAVLFTRHASMPTVTARYLRRHRPATVFAVGTEAAQAAPHLPARRRVVGPNRFATAVKVANRFFPKARGVAFTSGTSVGDAMSAGAYGGHSRRPVVFVGLNRVPAVVQRYVERHRRSFDDAVLIAGHTVVSDLTLRRLTRLLRHR